MHKSSNKRTLIRDFERLKLTAAFFLELLAPVVAASMPIPGIFLSFLLLATIMRAVCGVCGGSSLSLSLYLSLLLFEMPLPRYLSLLLSFLQLARKIIRKIRCLRQAPLAFL
jgi:hypothetical protein